MPPLLRAAALLTWILVGLPVLLSVPQHVPSFIVWLLAFLILGGSLAALGMTPDRNGLPVLHLALQAICVITMVRLLCNGYEGALLVLIAIQLGLLVSRREGLMWIALQSGMMFWAIATHWSPRPAILLTPPYVGFQILAFFTFQILATLERRNAELMAMNEMFAETSRIAERLRISQELHDALGHHLTALSLNLETAAHQTEEPARSNVRKAQSLARLLLGDVREIVHALGSRGGIEVEPALRALTSGVPRPRIHLSVPSGLRVSDPDRAHVVMRCTQEIITNAIRHSGAANLWIEVLEVDGGVEVRARDDGRGADAVRAGQGLDGMRGRLAAVGGSLAIDSRPGLGFAVVAMLPGSTT